LAGITAVVTLAACGHTEKVGVAGTVELALTEYRLTPQSVRMPSGEVTIVAHNYGRLAHNVDVLRDGHSAGSTSPIAPGQTATLSVYLLPGSYVMASTLFNDQALGAYGTITVTRGASG
jgi:hypothetical protein